MVKYELAKIKNRNILMVPKGLGDMSFNGRVDDIIAKMKERIEREVPDKGFFRNFAEDLSLDKSEFFGKAAPLCIERDENIDGNALLLLSVLHPSMNVHASVMLASGTRKTLLEYMNKKDFKNEVINTIHELSESLKG